MKKYLLGFCVLLIPVVAFAQAAPAVDSDNVFATALLQSLGGMKGLSTLGIVALAVQLLMKFMDTSLFAKLVSPKLADYKLPVVSLLSIVSGVVALMTKDNLPLGMALLHSMTLSSAMVFANQWIKFLIPSSSAPAAPPVANS